MSRTTIKIEVLGAVHSTVETLHRQAMIQLADILDVDAPEEAAKQVADAEFKIVFQEYVRVLDGDIIGTFPIYRGYLEVQLRNDKDAYYSGKLF